MNHRLVACLVVLCCSALPAQAQRADPANSLARARSTFTASDSDKDAKISVRELEANALKIDLTLFAATDHDKDGFWSREEFVVYYKQLLKGAGQRAADDLEQEVARILAVRKAQEVERAEKLAAASRKAANSTPKVVGQAGAKDVTKPESPAKPTETVVDVEARLQRALDELEKKAAARGATREDFGAVRDLYTARAKASVAGAGASPAADTTKAEITSQAEIAARFQRALDDLEKNALEGKWSREEFTQMRDMLTHRARAAASDPLPAPVGEKPAVDPGTTKESVAARFESALADLEKKAAGRSATREDFQRVKELLVARAREAWNLAEPKGDAAAQQAYGVRIDQLYTAVEQAATGTESTDAVVKLRKALLNPAVATANEVKVGGPADQRSQSPSAQSGTPATTGARDSAKPASTPGTPSANGSEGARKNAAESGTREAPKDGAKPDAPSAARAQAAGAPKPATPPESPAPKPAGPAKEREQSKEKEAEKPAPTTPPQNRGGGQAAEKGSTSGSGGG